VDGDRQQSLFESFERFENSAALKMDKLGTLLVADTGSTNGTHIYGVRIPYGEARPIADATSWRSAKSKFAFAESIRDNDARTASLSNTTPSPAAPPEKLPAWLTLIYVSGIALIVLLLLISCCACG